MTNKEWLDYLAHNAPDELAAWFDAEHVENQERALDGDESALNARIAELERKLRISWEYECKFQDERDVLQAEVDTLKVECDDLTSTCDDLENELHKAKAEREQYRKLFGMALDWAHEITMLESSVDEGMA